MSSGLLGLLLQLGNLLLDVLLYCILLAFFLVCLVIAMELALIASRPFRPRAKASPHLCK